MDGLWNTIWIKIPNFTGISDPYEAPEKPEITLHSHEMSLDEEVELLMATLQERGILSA